LHTRARVNKNDERTPFDEADRSPRIAECQYEQSDEEKLEKQREKALQSGKETRRLLVLKDPLP
jgi:hypothetical protein